MKGPAIISIRGPMNRQECAVIPPEVRRRLENLLADVLERECGTGHVTGSRAPMCGQCHRHRVVEELEMEELEDG